jgi:hypothetical protein
MLADTAVTVDGSGDREIHSVVLPDLDAETVYFYAVASCDNKGKRVESQIQPFKTAVEPNTPFSFAVTSEMGGCRDVQGIHKVYAQIQRYRPDFLLIVGDAVCNGAQYDDWKCWLFDSGKDLFGSTPFYLCQGNHEENADWYYRYVGYPEPKNYYSFDYGNAHFTALDSTAMVDYVDHKPVATDELGPGGPQYEYLVNDLAESTADWKFVFFHYPPYVSGDYEVPEMRALCPVFEKYNVDLVLNSHTIVYERSHPLSNDRMDPDGGVIYVVAGGCGARPEWFHPMRSWHTAQALAVPHFVQVIVGGPTIQLNTIDLDGRLIDTWTMRK